MNSPPPLPAFELGNFTAWAMYGDPSRWETHAARGLCGLPDATGALRDFEGPLPRFYRAVALWIGGREAAAAALLKRSDHPGAAALLRLIQKPKIHVLAQMPDSGFPPHILLRGALSDPKFAIRNISFNEFDFPHYPNADIFSFTADGFPPDFYIVNMLEWHVIPKNIARLNCPIIAASADIDLHLQTMMPWLKVFDEIIVNDHTAWTKYSNLHPTGKVMTFPKMFGIGPMPLPPQGRNKRTFDVFFSGTAFHPYHPEKARLVAELIDDLDRPMIVDGFVRGPTYFNALAKSRSCISFVRDGAVLPTRTMESLAMGCPSVVQEESVLTLFANANDGLLTYTPEPGGAIKAIRQILDNEAEFRHLAAWGARRIRQRLKAGTVASQFFRFLTYRAAMLEERDRPAQSTNLPASVVIHKGFIGAPPRKAAQIVKANIATLAEAAQGGCPRAAALHAREILIEEIRALGAAKGKTQPSGALAAPALFLDLARTYPCALVAGLNAVRVAAHFGTQEQRKEAITLARNILSLPKEGLSLTTEDDVLPYDLLPEHFDYRTYTDLLMEEINTPGTALAKMKQVIFATLHAYLGTLTGDIIHLRRGILAGPNFPYPVLVLTRALLDRDTLEDRAEAKGLLDELVQNGTAVRTDALQLLRELALRQEQKEEAARYLDSSGRIGSRVLTTGWGKAATPLADAEHFRLETPHFISIVKGRRKTKAPPFSVLIAGAPDMAGRAWLDQLLPHFSTEDGGEIIWAESSGIVPADIKEKANQIVASPSNGNLWHTNQALNRAFLVSHAPVIAICDGARAATPLPPFQHSLKTLVEIVFAHPQAPDVALVDMTPGMAKITDCRKLLDRACRRDAPFALVARRQTFLHCAGFDEASWYGGAMGGTYEVLRRLLNLGFSWGHVTGQTWRRHPGEWLCARQLRWRPDFQALFARDQKTMEVVLDDLLSLWHTNPLAPLSPNRAILDMRDQVLLGETLAATAPRNEFFNFG